MNTKAYFINKPPAGVREIVLGQGGDVHYYVLIENNNALLLRLDFPVEWGAFREVEVFGDHVAIGVQDMFYLFDITKQSCMTLKLDGYFGHLYIEGGELFVCSATDIICIGSDGATRWTSDKIAVDGVIINSFDGNILRVSAEMDPPGGWVDVLVSRRDGSVIDQVIS